MNPSGPVDLLPGAYPDDRGTTFVVFSTTTRDVAVRLYERGHTGIEPTWTVALDRLGEGRFATHVPGVGPGSLYMVVLDGDEVPDPCGRFFPLGVHGPARVEARVVAPALREPLPPSRWILYELHVGAFSPEGTYRGAERRLDAIVDLGATAIELMPVAAFAGGRGWGYDAVALYAPHAPYGEPDDLRAFVRAAHARGLAVILDAVYNHFGPSGNYLARYAPEYLAAAFETPWGAAPDFAVSGPMRALALDSVRHWLEEYGFDALRLDATDRVRDRSPRHVLREMTDLAHGLAPPRRVFFEDPRNDPSVVTDLGADAVWADDFHHQVHVLLTGERDGYYAAFEPSVEALAATIREGVRYVGQPYAPWKGQPRGKPMKPSLRPDQLVFCIQNHDQIGNRAFGTRLSRHVDVDAYCAASMLLLFLPATPLLFMGQEWAASSPFLFFSDHEDALAEAVREGRRRELRSFAEFRAPEAETSIPDPQSEATFARSRLVWEERAREPHARVFAIYRAMLQLRRHDAVLAAPSAWSDLEVLVEGELLEVVRRAGGESRRLLVNFGAREAHVSGAPAFSSSRVLLVSGAFRDDVLAPRSAVLFAA